MAKATAKAGGGGNDGRQTIEQLQQRYRDLDRRKIQAETQRDEALKRLEELKAEARQSYGTDDLDALRTKLAEMKDENERKRAEYQAQLDGIESSLAEVEAKFEQAAGGQADEDEGQR